MTFDYMRLKYQIRQKKYIIPTNKIQKKVLNT